MLGAARRNLSDEKISKRCTSLFAGTRPSCFTYGETRTRGEVVSEKQRNRKCVCMCVSERERERERERNG